MICSLEDLKRKEVIDISNGDRLGYIDDAEMDLENSTVKALIIYGRHRFFGLLGRDSDIVIPCADIRVVGSEVILVKLSISPELSHSIKNGEKESKSLFKYT